MRRLLKYELKGNTIMEVMIAMAILTFCSVLAVIIYLNIQKSTTPFFKIKAVELAELYMKKAIEENKWYNEEYKAEEFSIRSVVERDNVYNDCFKLRVLIFDVNKKKIHELEQLVFKKY